MTGKIILPRDKVNVAGFGTKIRSLHGCIIVNLTSFVSTFVVSKIHTDMYTHTIRTYYCHPCHVKIEYYFLLLKMKKKTSIESL